MVQSRSCSYTHNLLQHVCSYIHLLCAYVYLHLKFEVQRYDSKQRDALKVLSHGAIFLATCNAILLLVDTKLANTRFHHSFANIFLTYQTFVTNLHLLRVELRCKLLLGNLHRVTGPLAHHVVLNHTFELLINATMLF